MIGKIDIEGKFFRDVDRLMGRIPALDAAIQKRLPGVLNEIGDVIVGKARFGVPRLSGVLASAIGKEVRGDKLAVGVWGVDYAYPTELGSPGGSKTPMIVNDFTRTQSVIFGERVSPFKVAVSQFVRRTKIKRQQFLFPSYYASFSAMFGILNRTIEDCKKEVELDG